MICDRCDARGLSHRLDRITRNFLTGAPLFYYFFLLCGTSRRFVHSLANWIPMRMDELPQAFVQAFAVLSTLQSWQRWRFLGDFACSIAMQAIYIHFFTFAFCGSLRTFVHSLLNWIPMRMNELPIECEPSRPLTIFFSILCQKW